MYRGSSPTIEYALPLDCLVNDRRPAIPASTCAWDALATPAPCTQAPLLGALPVTKLLRIESPMGSEV